jgi:hypothetical protein
MPETKKQSRFSQKVPEEAFTSPGEMVCLFIACFIESLDWIFDFGHLIYLGSWETVVAFPKVVLDLAFALMSAFLLGISPWSNLLPFLIERIPFLSTISPTWVIRILIRWMKKPTE